MALVQAMPSLPVSSPRPLSEMISEAPVDISADWRRQDNWRVSVAVEETIALYEEHAPFRKG